MAIEFSCVCGQRLKFRDEYARGVVKCPKCGEALKVPEKGATQLPPRTIDQYGIEGDKGQPQRREYKILKQKDFWISGEFDPVKLEHMLNAYAKKGWVVRSIATASTRGIGSQRDEVIVVLEREVC